MPNSVSNLARHILHTSTTLAAALALAALVLTTLAVGVADAGPKRNHDRRVLQGLRSGELTASEAARLRQQRAEVRDERRDAAADGVVTPGEAREIREEVREENALIYRLKHNDRSQ